MSSDGKLMKMDKNFAAEVDQAIKESEQQAKSGKLQVAVDNLLVVEKQTRVGADMASNGKVLVQIVKLCGDHKDYKLLQEQLVALSKKHGLLKQAITKMVQAAVPLVEQLKNDKPMRLEFLQTLLQITEGKIYVEIERARLTRQLAAIKEKEDGNVSEAAEILQALQVETFGSMDKREKTDFILEQMRLNLARKDYIRAQLISKKISTKYFDGDEQVDDLKLRYYDLMIQWAMHDSLYLEMSQFYGHIYATKSIAADELKWQLALKMMVVCVCLASHNNEQSNLLNRVVLDKKLEKLPLYKQLIKSFTTQELIRWQAIQQLYGSELKQQPIFGGEDGQRRWQDLHDRVTEHNVRVVAKYYSAITTKRLTELLDLSGDAAEEFLSKLVSNKVIYAKIDRIDGTISFEKPRKPDEIVDEWTVKVHQLLDLVSRTNHLIAKEEMVAGITKKVVVAGK